MNDVLVSAIPTEHVDAVWPVVAPYINSALDYARGCYALEDVYDQLTSGTHFLWIAFEGTNIKGCVITQVVQYPRKRVLACFMAGGENLNEWKAPMLELLTKFAIDNECDAFEASGRPGWVRMFRNEGCETVWQTCQMPITRS